MRLVGGHLSVDAVASWTTGESLCEKGANISPCVCAPEHVLV